MNFVFESKRHSGCGGKQSDEPDYPAVKISSYIDKNKAAGTKRFRFAFTQKTVAYARWIKGDRLTCGADSEHMLLAFKRDPTGYKIVGKQFSESAKDRPSIQITVDDASAVSIIADMCLGKWIRLSESGVLLVTERIDK